MVAHLLLSWLHVVPLFITRKHVYIIGVQTQMSWLCSQTSCHQAPRLPLPANLRDGLSDPGKAGGGEEMARRTHALRQRRAWVANGFLSSSSASQPAGIVQGKVLEGKTGSFEGQAAAFTGCSWLKQGPPSQPVPHFTPSPRQPQLLWVSGAFHTHPCSIHL